MKKLVLAALLLLPILLWATPYINEIYYDTPASGDAGSFTEIKGDPGESLDNYYLVGINGGDGSEYARIDLSGYTIPADSYFVVADSNIVSNYDMIDTLVDWQNGPDNVALIYDDGTTVDTIDVVGYGNFSSATFVGHGYPAVDVSGGIALARRSSTDNNAADFIGTETPTPGTANTYDEGTAHSIYDIQYVTDPATDDASPLEGQVVKFVAVVTANTGSKLYVQDGEGEWNGVIVYVSYDINPGDSITVIGKVTEYYNVTEISPVYALIPSGGNGNIAVTTITGDLVGEAYEGQFIRIANATVINDSLGYGEWLINDGYGDVRVDDEMYSIRPDSGHLYAYVQGPLNYSWYNYKIEPRDENDLKDPATITGTVTLSDNPSDMSGTTVTFVANDVSYTATTNTDGTYSVDIAVPNTYTVTFSHDGYTTYTIEDTLIDTAGTIDAQLTYLATISGTVNLADNPEDLSGTIVEITDGTNVYTDTTDVDGTYSISGVVTGISYLISYIHPGYESYTVDTVIDSDMVIDVTLNLLTYTVYGTVTLTDNPDDMSGTNVYLANADTSYYAVTDSTGYYSIPDVVPGTYEITFTHENYDTLVDTIEVVNSDVEYNGSLNNTYAGGSYVFKIDAPYPNPFRDNTTISLTTPNSADVSVKVYDISGKLIKTVAEGTVNKGVHTFTWDRTDKKGMVVPTGVYFMKVNYNNERYIYRVIVLQ